MNIRRTFSTVAVSTLLCLSASQTLASSTVKAGTFLAVTGDASFLGNPELKTLETV